MKEKGDQCILVGYSTQSKGYQVYNKRTRMMVESIHIRFDEIKEVFETSFSNNTSGLVPQRQKASDYDNPDPLPQRQDVFSSADADVPSQQELDLLFGPLYDEFFNADPEMCMYALIVSTAEPKNIKEAMADSAWIETMQEELHQFDRLQDEDQTVIHNKARLVAKGTQVFSNLSDGRKTTFLNGPLKEEVYVAQPDGFVDPDHPEKVYRLRKALYGLKQALRAWYDELSKFLTSKGFTKGQVHFYKHGMDKGQSIGTPMPTKPKLDGDLSGNPIDQTDYRSKIRSLMYLTSSRPDIVQAGFSFELTAFSDADHARCIDSCKSTSGEIQFLCDKLVSWMSKKQNCTVMSLAEAEYVALSASCVQKQFDKEKVGEENVQQYVLFPLWSSGSTNPQNTDRDVAFEGKKPEFEVLVAGQISTNNTNTFSAAGPSNTVVSPTHGKYSYMDPSQYPDDPNMPALEDITYSDDEEDVGVEADFTNLETNITEEGIDYAEVFAPVARIGAIRLFLAYASFMGFMVYQMDGKSAFLYRTIKEEVYVCQPLGFEDPDYHDKREKIDQTLFIKKQKGDILLVQRPDGIFISQDKYVAKILRKFGLTDRKSASTPIDTEKPLLKDPNGEDVDVDVHSYRLMIGSLMYLTSSRPDIMFAVYALSRMGYEKPSTKLTFYNAFFSPQWKFFIYTILQCMSAKRTSWNEFSSSMASAVICLSTGMIVAQQADDVADEGAAGVDVEDVPAANAEPSLPSPTPTNQPPPPSQELPSTSQVYLLQLHHQLKVEALEQDKVAQALEIIKLKQKVKKLERKNKLKLSRLKRLRKVRTAQRVESSVDTIMDDQEDASKQGEIIANIDVNENVTLKDVAAIEKTIEIEKDANVQGRLEESQAQIYKIDLEHADKDDELEPAELKEVVEVVTTSKLMTKVVTAAATITAATTPITAATITAAPSAARRRKGVVIRDPKETATPSIIMHTEPKSKEKGKGIRVEEPKPLKKQAHVEQDEAYARDQKQMLDEEVEELKKHLQIVPNIDDDVYTEATPLALKVLIVDYEIYSENNKPYFKIIRADGNHQLFLSFLSLLRNFDREDLEGRIVGLYNVLILYMLMMFSFGVDADEDFKGILRDKIICDLDKTPDLPQRSPQNCPKCGHPINGHYCQGCALFQKKIKEDLFTSSIEHGILQDSSELSNDNPNVVNALREPFVVNQDPGKNSSQSPPQINHHCCYGCGDPLEGIFCHQCTYKLYGNGAHYGYNCPLKVPIIPNPKPFTNQTIKELPPNVQSFDPKSNLVHDSPNVFDPPPQLPFYSCEFCGNDAHYGHYYTLQVSFVCPKPCYNQDFNFSPEFQEFHDFQQQDLCCENYEITMKLTNQYTVNHHIFNAQNDLFDSQNKLMEQLTSMCDMVGQFIQKKGEEKKIEEEQAANARYWKILACYDDANDDYDFAITPNEPVNSLSMGDEHLDTILATESDEVIKSSVENLVPIPSESEGEPECDMPTCEEFTTFSNIPFDSDNDFYSSNDQSFFDEDFSKEIYSNPLFDEEIISIKIDQHLFNAESDVIESMFNRDSSIISSSRIDSLFDEFAGELTHFKSIPIFSAKSNAAIKSFSPSLIPVEDSDSLIEEIDLSFTPDYPMPPGIEDDDYDSERDILVLHELLSNDSLSLPENKSFHFDIPSFSRPPAKPPDGNTEILNVKMMGDISVQKVPMPKLMITIVPNQEKSPDLLSHLGLKTF
uniref:Reverse transcriptase Ty1/copia-type domain-containing protein n=1 Tax=Tanacetum cinerariifolium TaxID=118510 RepID=A0A6L2LW52_TANCI|nr:hypothetical protein [Tanacetum cinerariifolium]